MPDIRSRHLAEFLTRLASKIREFAAAYSRTVANIDIRLLVALNSSVWVFATLALFSSLVAVPQDDTFRKLSSDYWPWIRNYFFPTHKFEIAAIAIVIAILGLLATSTLYLLRQPDLYIERRQRRLHLLVYVGIAAIILNRYISYSGAIGLGNAALLCLVSFVSVVAPVFPTAALRVPMSAARLGTVVLIAEVIAICAFFGAGYFPIASDYLEIPSTVFVRDRPEAKTRPVDTISYINERRLFGNHRIPDFRVSPQDDLPCEQENQIKLPNGPALTAWVREHRESFYINSVDGTLCFVGGLSTESSIELGELFPSNKEQIALASVLSAQAQRKLLERPRTYSDLDFGRKINVQLVNFYHDLETQFHHQFQYLNPIKEHELGKPLSEINAPYGLSFLVIEQGMRWLGGGITFQSFIGVMFLIQAVYIIAFICLVHWLLRSWPSTLGVAAVLVASFTGLGVSTMYEGFGYGPARHGLDILIIVFFARYLWTLDGRNLVAATLGVALNLGLDRFVGSFCGFALAVTLVFRALTNITPRLRFEAVYGILLAISIVGFFLFLGGLTAENPYAEQFFDGVWGFPVDKIMLFFFLAWASIALGATVWSIAQRADSKKSLAIFLVAYSLLFVFYWLMVPNFGHLYKVFPYVALATVVVWRECIRENVPLVVRQRIGKAGIVLSLLVWAQLSRFMIATGIEKVRYFRANELYEWNFAHFKATTAMDPAPFKASVDLIDKNTSLEGGVSILSEYDSILLFLSDRVSAMSHFEVGTFLNSPLHSKLVLDDIKRRRPETLIVDTCIRCSPTPYRIVRPVPGLNTAYLPRALEKIDRLQRLRDVFAEVEADYRLVSAGPLVSVWKRKSD